MSHVCSRGRATSPRLRTTPQEVVSKLHTEIVEAVGRRERRESFAGERLEPVGSTRAELEDTVRGELEGWGIRARNITFQ